MKNKATQYAHLEASFKTFSEEFQDASTKLKRSEELFQTLQTGLSSSSQDETAGGFLGALAEVKKTEQAALTEIEQSKLKQKHLVQSLKETSVKFGLADKTRIALQKERAAELDKLTSIDAKLQTSATLKAQIEELSTQERSLMSTMSDLSEVRNIQSSPVQSLTQASRSATC